MANLNGSDFTDDSLSGSSANDIVQGMGGNDTLLGRGGNDSLVGGEGNDYLNGGTGVNTLAGGAGDDTYEINATTDVVMENAGEGTDKVRTWASNYTLGENVEQLELLGTAVVGTGNALANLLQGNNATNTLSGADGNDVLEGRAGVDILAGDAGDDTVSGGTENDLLYGGDGNDRLDGGLGADQMLGELGNDTYDVDDVGDIVTEGLAEGVDLVHTTVNYTLSANVENLQLLGTVSNGTGNTLANAITGNAVANNLRGGGGADTIDGGAGNDVLRGEGGSDLLRGGAGNDTYMAVRGGGVNTIEDGGAGETDRLLFANVNVTHRNLWLVQNGNDLLVRVLATNSYDRIKDYFTDVTHGWTLQLSDGAALERADIDALVAAMAPLAMPSVSTIPVDGIYASLSSLVDQLWYNQAPTDIALDNSSVDENSAGGTVVGVLSATDPNAGDTFSYALTDDAGGRFVVVGNELRVAAGANLDRETSASHDVTVRVADAGGLTHDRTFSVTVNNVNETPTDIALDNSAVNENSAGGTVVGVLSATDPDAGDTFGYALTDDAGGRFVVVGNELRVASGASLDREANASHDVTVRVTDAGGLMYDKAFTITVNNVNEAPTANDDAFTTNEDAALLLSVLSNDADPDSGDSKILVSVSGAVSGATATLSGSNINYSPGTAFQYLKPGDTATNILTYTMRDAAGLQSTATATVTITGVNDAPTAPTFSTNPVVREGSVTNGQVLATLSSTDADGDSLTYSISSGSAGIGLNGNQLVVTDASNFSAPNGFYVYVFANDGTTNSSQRYLAFSVVNAIESPVVANGSSEMISSYLTDATWSRFYDENSDGSAGGVSAGESGYLYGFNSPLVWVYDNYLHQWNQYNFGLSVFSSQFSTQSGYGEVGAYLGDINGDGVEDRLIANGNATANSLSSAGAGLLISGGGANTQFWGGSANARMGNQTESVSCLGDFNGDGYSDFAVAGQERFEIIYGRADIFSSTVDLGLTGYSNGSLGTSVLGANVGRSVSSAGDVNGDGYVDLVVGSDYGFAYLVLGRGVNTNFGNVDLGVMTDLTTSAPVSGVYKLQYSANSLNTYFRSVSGGGDINGDGYADVLIGSRYGDAGVYVVWGSASGWGAVDLSATPNGRWTFFSGAGYSVAGAGDVNGDGYDDFIAGSPNENGQRGSAYVVFGRADIASGAEYSISSLMDGVSGFMVSAQSAGDGYFLGKSVAGNTDINGDGFSDVVVRSTNYSQHHTETYWVSSGWGGGYYVTDSYGYFNPQVNGIYGGSSSSSDILGATENDALTGTFGADHIIAGSGNDTLVGNGGADVMRGGSGDDRIVVADTGFFDVDGGVGTDTLKFSGSNLSIDLTAIANTRIERIEKIDISSGTNVLTLNLGEVLALSTSSNTLRVFGVAGDVVDTGSGWTRTNVAYTNDGGHILDRYTNGAGVLLIEQAIRVSTSGTSGNDTLTGTTGADFISGYAGNDSIDGDDGNDTLLGGDGGDTLAGSLGADAVYGGNSADSLFGGAGSDILEGGAGNDTLSGDAGNDTLSGGGGSDRAILAGDNGDYQAVVDASGGVTVTDNNTVNGDEGVDVLTGVESLAFADGSVLEVNTSGQRANTWTANDQSAPSVTVLANGDYVVAWTSSAQDSVDSDVYFQRFNSAGVALGSETRANTVTANGQYHVAVSALSTGDFVVTWSSVFQDGDWTGVFGRRYNGDGVAQDAAEFQINTYTTNDQYKPAIAAISGGFGVAWTSAYQDGGNGGIYAQRFNTTSVKQGAEFIVNTNTANDQTGAAITGLSSGDFIVVWTSGTQDGSGAGIYGQRFNSSGTKQGSEFLVNTFTTGDQQYASIAALGDGGFVVTWTSAAQDGSDNGVYAQRYNSTAVAQGAEFRVNTTTTGAQLSSVVSALSDGGFVVAWRGMSQDGSGYNIYAQRFNASGTAVGSEILVNAVTAGDQREPAVVGLANGDFLVSWSSQDQDGSGYGVYTQVFDRDGNAAITRLQLGSTAISGSGTDRSDDIVGNTLDNSLRGGSGHDTLLGDAGNDTLDGESGMDSLAGGAGNDTYQVDSTADRITERASEGTDVVLSSVSGYVLSANVENLTLLGTVVAGTGNGGANVLTGNSANNVLDGGGSGTDTLVGGLGNDTYTGFVTASQIVENLDEGVDQVNFVGNINIGRAYTLPDNVENLTISGYWAFSYLGANGTGNALDNRLVCNSSGSSYSDTVTGLGGNDTLVGRAYSDRLVGGTGDDTYEVNGTSNVVVENAGASEGTDLIKAFVSGYTMAANVENLVLMGTAMAATGNTGNNVMTGNASANNLNGGAGSDTLVGGGGADTFVGGTGEDVLVVEAGQALDLIGLLDSRVTGIERIDLNGNATLTLNLAEVLNISTESDVLHVFNGASGGAVSIGVGWTDAGMDLVETTYHRYTQSTAVLLIEQGTSIS